MGRDPELGRLKNLCSKTPTLDFAAQGNCRDADPEIFYPNKGGINQALEAMEVCQDCPVRIPCLAWALCHEKFGIWGGTSDSERRKLRKALGITLDRPEAGGADEKPQCGTHLGYHRHRRRGETPCEACVDAFSRMGNPLNNPKGPQERRWEQALIDARHRRLELLGALS